MKNKAWTTKKKKRVSAMCPWSINDTQRRTAQK
jgi:hypothetical protein